jgi:hypothetical protein
MALILSLGFMLLGSGCKKKQRVIEEVVDENISQEQVAEPLESTAPEEPKDSLFLYYQKTPCFGTCPIFKMTIYRSGYAIYKGDNFVDMMGDFEARFSEGQMEAITAMANQVGYFDMGERYDDPMVTDLPSTIVEMLNQEGKRKKVLNRYQGPAEIQDLYKLINEMIDQVEWKPIENKK